MICSCSTQQCYCQWLLNACGGDICVLYKGAFIFGRHGTCTEWSLSWKREGTTMTTHWVRAVAPNGSCSLPIGQGMIPMPVKELQAGWHRWSHAVLACLCISTAQKACKVSTECMQPCGLEATNRMQPWGQKCWVTALCIANNWETQV